MNITVIGAGYVGLVTGTCLANVGNDVLCLELDAGLDMELDALKEVFLHADALEGMKALLENRKPSFQQPARV